MPAPEVFETDRRVGRRRTDERDHALTILKLLYRFERRTMTELDTLKAAVADLTAAQADTGTKVNVLLAQNDTLVELTDTLSDQLVALGEAGQIPPGALSDLTTIIDNAKTAYVMLGNQVAAESTKVAAAIAADTPPAPAPVDPPAPSPAPAPSDPVDPAVEPPADPTAAPSA